MSNSNSFQTHSSDETQQLAAKIASQAEPGDILAFYGNLAGGKTTFIQGFGEALNAREPITSPTFTLINEYHARIPLYHFDCYRLSGVDELYDIGYEEYFYGEGITLIEWADKVEPVIPAYAYRLYFTHLFDGEASREIKIECPDGKEAVCNSL